MVQINNYIKKYTVRNILFIFNSRSKIYNQSGSHKSVRMVLAFKVNTKIILLDHSLHCNTTTFQLPSIICMLLLPVQQYPTTNSCHFKLFSDTQFQNTVAQISLLPFCNIHKIIIYMSI